MTKIIAVLWLIAISPALALCSTTMLLHFTCPIDSTKFEARIQTSSYTRGGMLDLEPLGAIITPNPLPVCPTDHFVIYADTIPPDDVAKLRPYVLSSSYQDQVSGNSTYFLLAKLKEYLGTPPLEIGIIYLQASWESSGDSLKHRECIAKSLASFVEAIPHASTTDEDWIAVELLCGELQRQLGIFVDARTRIQRLLDGGGLSEHFTRMAEYELSLIAQRDSLRHEIPKTEGD